MYPWKYQQPPSSWGRAPPLDLSAVFDHGWYPSVARHLLDLGVGSTVLWRFRAFLSDRSQKVLLLGELFFEPLASELWGSTGPDILPLLFNIVMKSLGETIRRLGLVCHQYAAVTQLHL